jgi:hypothetical protein
MRLCLVRSFLISAVLALGFGCGGGSSSYMLPVDSPLKPFEAPTEEALVAAAEEDDWDIDLSDDEDEDEVEDEGEPEGDAGEAAPADKSAGGGDAAKVEAKPAKASAGKADATKAEKKPETKKAR